MKGLVTAYGAVLILCLAAIVLVRLQISAPRSHADQPEPENAHMNRGWRYGVDLAHRYEQARPITAQGEQAMAKGNFAEAEVLFRQALAIFPHEARSMLRLAEVYEREGKQQEALRAYHELVYPQGWGSNINSDPTTRMKYVLALTRANRWREAVAVYNLAMRSSITTNGYPMMNDRFDPNRRDVTHLQAVAHYVLGTARPTFAPPAKGEQIKHLEAAARLQPINPLSQYAYGQALEKEGDKTAAAAAYRQAASHANGDLKATAEAAYQRLAQSSRAAGGPPR